MTYEDFIQIYTFLNESHLSIDFVHKLTDKYGSSSILKSFYLDKKNDMNYLDFLLHKYKGKYFGEIFPNISLI